jgi:murein peptide amidase A
MRKILFLLTILFTAFLWSGCIQLAEHLYIDPDADPIITAHPSPARLVAGQSVEGRPIHYLVFGRGPEVVMILAGIHGDEAAGTPLVRELARRIERHPRLIRGRQVIIVPVVNPDGLAHYRRTNIRGVDLNRNFAAANRENSRRYGREPLSEPEAQALDKLLWEFSPDRIVSIHQPLEVIDYDGPAEELARHMGEETWLPVKRLGGRPGSLGSYAGTTLGIPIITLELPREADGQETDVLWRDYGQSLLAAIRFREGKDGWKNTVSAQDHLNW